VIKPPPSHSMRGQIFSRAAWALILILIDVAISATCLPPYTGNTTYVGCFSDPFSPRDLTGPLLTLENSNSPQACANICGAAGYTFSGVEFTV
jgi:beta-D-xylosidase 4